MGKPISWTRIRLMNREGKQQWYWVCSAKVGTHSLSRILFEQKPQAGEPNVIREMAYGSRTQHVIVDIVQQDGIVFCSLL